MSWGRRQGAALLALATLGSGAFALRLGQDNNPDQLIYHVYLGWSLLAGRLDQDVAPVGLAGSYMNPLAHTLSYLGMTLLPPRVHAFVLGAVQGLNVFLVYLLARVVLRGIPRERALAALAGLVAAAGPCAVSLLGTTFLDNLVSILVLAAFLVLARAADQPDRASRRRLLTAGLLGGAAVGLKLTFAMYLVALFAAVLLLALRERGPRVSFLFGAGTAAGYLLTAGYWGALMWQRFGNPVFPYANDVFRSPYLPPLALHDPRWVTRGWTELLSVPFDMALGLTGGLQEVPFRDVRYAILLGLALAAVALALRCRGAVAAPTAALVVVVGWMAAYATWMAVFHYYRYFAAGELLAPVAILGLLRLLAPRRLPVAWLAIALVVVVTARTGSWGRIRWRDEPLHVSVPLARTEKPAVVMVDGFGFSFVLPFFPPGTRFFGIHRTLDAFDRVVARELGRHGGPVFRLRPQGAASTPLERLGLEDEGSCETFRTGGRGRLLLCPLVRVPPS